MFIIVMLCNDDGKCYIDYVNKRFDTLEQAKEEMFKCVNNEYKSLQELGNYAIVNLDNEVFIYDENKELVTNYRIINIDSEVEGN